MSVVFSMQIEQVERSFTALDTAAPNDTRVDSVCRESCAPIFTKHKKSEGRKET